ncbi:MAG TPA: pyridoxal phosphate-dependent aminotransferase [Aminobacterium sp.]|jgi:aspartate aminotransferase|uniref:pyridoxal phosphate-dependent aminotransferase n=3 Tax=Aminobacteriaceae TaxID=3029087 RepID=UPI0004679462|nr:MULTISPECIES: pyridoxal phosphate-dependent aminotransferase [Aminobacterium]HCA40167.1 pyridoxal phosphate-dependent aminotransferase [Aminobacterium sp.]
MKFSKRITSMQSSPIRRLIPYADEAKTKGKKVYHLNIGQPDIKTPPSFLSAIKNFAQEVIAYSTSQGSNELRDAMRKYYENFNIHFDRDHILVTNGGSEAIMFSIMATCDPGDEILIPEPFYANYNAFSQCVSVNVVPITTKAEEGFHLPPREKIEPLISPRTRCILISNPGNPTGTIYTLDEMKMLAELAKKHNLFIIADEVYREFVYDGLKYTSFGNLPEIEDRVIIVDSVSKRYSACGARIGCIASKNLDLMKEILKLCQGRLCVPTLEQVGATALYSTPVSYLEDVNKEYQTRRDTLYKALKEMPGVVCEQPKGAFYVMVKMPVDDAEKFVIWMLQNYDINGETMMAAPGEGFYATPGLGKNEARLAYVLNNEDIVKAMNILKGALEAYPGKIESIAAK